MGEFRNSGTNRFSGGHGGHGGGFKGRGGRPSFGGDRGGFRGGDRGPVTMHKVICDECKKPCEVPFLPTAGKPVYCSACFGGKKEMGGNDRGGKPNFGGDRFPMKTFGDYKTPPRTDFGADVNKVSGSEIKKQIEVLNVKIDRLSKIIEDMAGTKTSAAPAKAVAVAPVKVASVTKTVKKAVKKVSKKK
jgi:CxxC-x17-CxxC domain-containing protein